MKRKLPRRTPAFAGYLKILGLLALIVCMASATDLKIRLPDLTPVTRTTFTYECDAAGLKIGVPSTPFEVEYIDGGGNSLVVVPIAGNSLIFSAVTSNSGERYTTQKYTWWNVK